MHVLADTHAPQNHRRFTGGKFTRDFTQRCCRYAAYGRHGFGAIALNILLKCFVVVGTCLNEILIDQAFFNHGVDECIEHGHIGIGLELQCAPSVFANVGDTGICQDNLGPALGSVFHPGSGHRMVGCRVGTYDQNQASMFHIVHLIADSGRANAL